MLLEETLATDSATMQSLRRFYREREDRVLQHLLPIADISSAARSRAWERARQLVVEIRRRQVGKGGVDALLNEFALSTEEGVVLMCLAEALLRIPDSLTMDRLIRDKLASGNWSAHLGNSDSLFVNASAWGLLLTGKVVTYNDEHSEEQFGLLKKTMGRVGEPVIRASVRYAMQIMGTQFVMGTSINSAVQRAREEEARGYRYSYDMLGEGARTMADADRYYDSYMNAIEVIGQAAAGRGPYDSPGISVKLSAIHPRYEFSHQQRVVTELVPRLQNLAEAAKRHNIGFTVDAEEADRLEMSLDIIEKVFSSPPLADWDGFGIAIQAYQKRSIWVIEWVRELTQRVGRRMMVRLVKGAYWDTEIKLSQVEGFEDFPVFTRKAATDVSYQACARKLLEYRDTLYPQFATHNAYTVATVLEMDESRTGYEFQRLHGMGDALYDQVVQGESVPCRIYAPVGIHADLLAYLVRRLLENGANSSFVNNIVDENIPVESLLEDPVELARSWTNASNPQIASPAELYGSERPNAAGFDLTDCVALEQARSAMQTTLASLPLNFATSDAQLDIRNPADHAELVGTVSLDDARSMTTALERTSGAFDAWQATDVKERARLLFALADALETHRDELITLCCKEAGKTIPDSIAEIREAVDFCRYYAQQAVEQNFTGQGLRARGVILCISPWNFPLAIFLGQIAAALAVGNTVIAKPAEQTSLIALRTLDIIRSCGFPDDAVVAVIARGPDVGQYLVPDARIKAVMFTGSTETGAVIAKTLAERADAPVPLIAETGGQNCMLVDSTALPEQVVDDVIMSGFQSAGQRCSALRVLFLQEDIADKVIDMIIGAMKELTIGDPALLSTDIGPVIDVQALSRLQAHAQFMSNSGRLLYQCDAPSEQGNTFFAPRLYEISNLSLLEREVFGPVVHVVRYGADALNDVIDQINETGYGLTFGIHSRIEDITSYVAQRIQAGNIYINRNMIGAIVGVQPFGGRGLSGTGPKAGGPQYLGRLVTTGAEAENADGQRPLPAADTGSAVEALQIAPAAQKEWNQRSLNDRLSTLRQFIARYSQRPADEHSAILEETLAAARSQLLYARDVLEHPLELPGPTGESNQLLLEARGQLLLVIDNREHTGEYLLAMLSALAGGNVVTALAEEELLAEWQEIVSELIQAGLPEHCASVASLPAARDALSSPYVDGAMIHARSAYLHDAARLLAQRKGPLIPLITCVSPHTLLRQTLLEKTVSVDTTAAGGNASLMTMAS
ncbi:MAG: bifunctional proline dehydrogenase/L-glutamate gamma-semialdehyde dehydrogenase PutA [Halioglobus sp.]